MKYFVANLNKHTTQHQGRASRLLMRIGSDTSMYKGSQNRKKNRVQKAKYIDREMPSDDS